MVQGTIHILSGELSFVTGVDFHEFVLYTPMVVMVQVQNGVHHVPIRMLIFQG